MKATLAVIVVLGVLTLGCAQSDQGPPVTEATPTPTDEITEMDFESGEVEQSTDVTDDDGDGAAENGE